MKPDGDTLCKDLARNLARPHRAFLGELSNHSVDAKCVTLARFSANAGGLGTIVVSLARKETEGHRRSAHSAIRERFFCFSHREIWLS